MGFDFNNEVPIYLQIIEDIKMQIISNKYSLNQKLLSVREMSVVYGVNPNTIQKAFAELEDMGLVYTERTNGKFVTKDKKVVEKIRKQTIDKMMKDFVESMNDIGVDKAQIIDLLGKKE